MLFSLFPYASMILHVLVSFSSCFMPCLGLFSYVLMFGSTCSHAWYYVSGYALLRSTCLYACSMLLCLSPCQSHACMLGFAFSHAFMFISTCLNVYPHVYMRISMLICVDRCVYMLRSMFSTCHLCACVLHAMFMCLGLDLVCHAMCYCSPFVPFIAFFCVLA